MDKKAGTIGDTSVFSFNSNKVYCQRVNGGGVVMTDDEELAQAYKDD